MAFGAPLGHQRVVGDAHCSESTGGWSSYGRRTPWRGVHAPQKVGFRDATRGVGAHRPVAFHGHVLPHQALPTPQVTTWCHYFAYTGHTVGTWPNKEGGDPHLGVEPLCGLQPTRDIARSRRGFRLAIRPPRPTLNKGTWASTLSHLPPSPREV